MTTFILISIPIIIAALLYCRMILIWRSVAIKQNNYLLEYMKRKEQHNFLNDILAFERCPNYDK